MTLMLCQGWSVVETKAYGTESDSQDLKDRFFSWPGEGGPRQREQTVQKLRRRERTVSGRVSCVVLLECGAPGGGRRDELREMRPEKRSQKDSQAVLWRPAVTPWGVENCSGMTGREKHLPLYS